MTGAACHDHEQDNGRKRKGEETFMVTQTTEGLLIYSQDEDAYYLFPREAMEQARVSAEHRAAIEAAVAGSNDVSGFLLTNSVSTTPSAETLAQQQQMNSLQNALNTSTKTGGTLNTSLFTGLIGTWPVR
jgi:hypothetical protein